MTTKLSNLSKLSLAAILGFGACSTETPSRVHPFGMKWALDRASHLATSVPKEEEVARHDQSYGADNYFLVNNNLPYGPFSSISLALATLPSRPLYIPLKYLEIKTEEDKSTNLGPLNISGKEEIERDYLRVRLRNTPLYVDFPSERKDGFSIAERNDFVDEGGIENRWVVGNSGNSNEEPYEELGNLGKVAKELIFWYVEPVRDISNSFSNTYNAPIRATLGENTRLTLEAKTNGDRTYGKTGLKTNTSGAYKSDIIVEYQQADGGEESALVIGGTIWTGRMPLKWVRRSYRDITGTYVSN